MQYNKKNSSLILNIEFIGALWVSSPNFRGVSVNVNSIGYGTEKMPLRMFYPGFLRGYSFGVLGVQLKHAEKRK